MQTVIEIARPRAEVFAYAADPDHAPAWYENIKTVEWESPKALAVGARVAFMTQFLGRQLTYTYEIKELVPDERLVMSTTEGPFRMETTYTWEDEEAGSTKMTLRNRGEMGRFWRFAAPVMAAAVRRATRKDLERLKQILEQRDATEGSAER